jgi:hypothetical protein
VSTGAPDVRAADVPFTLHPVTTVARLRQLGRTMHNCLATYGDRLGGEHRIVEVHQGRTVRYAVHIEAGRIETFEAPGNRPPDPRDVAVVRRLLEQEGHLAATVAWGRAAPARPAAPPVPEGQLDLLAPTREAERPPRRREQPRERQQRPRPTSRSALPRPPGVSVQSLATELLGPEALRSPHWSEVAAALWSAGLLPRLPAPTETTFVRVVHDLAARVAIGEDAGLPRRSPATREERETARRRLLAVDAAGEGWQRRRMAAVLEHPVRP